MLFAKDEQKRYFASAADSLEALIADAHVIDNLYYGVYEALKNA